MVLVWSSYQTDLGRAYPFFALSTQQVNEISTNFAPLDLLPPAILDNLIEIRNPCAVGGLTPRYLSLFASDGAQFRITYPIPFDDSLAQFLTSNLNIAAWEFVGERLRYGRLRKLLDNV
ncbi:MAG: hypothetical protein AAF298_28855 [Cyanobacteria bacterium P01_A01_bin.40]